MLWVCISPHCDTKHHRLGGLHKRHVFLTVPEVKEFKIKVQADEVPSKDPLPGLAGGHFLLAPSHGGKRKLLSLSLFIRIVSLSWGPHPHNLKI